MMIPSEILRQVRRIEMITNRLVNQAMVGRYESAFKGRGIEFAEVREYQPGDEVRSIDWNVTARMGRPYLKRFVEERELTVMCLVDLSRSMAFGSVGKFKQRLATELCALLALSAIKNHDKVGLLLFTDRIEEFLPPRGGPTHVLRLIRDVLSYEPVGRGTDIRLALDYLARVTRRRTITFLISDWFCNPSTRPQRDKTESRDSLRVSPPSSRRVVLSERSESWFDSAHHDPERVKRVEGSKGELRYGKDEL